MRIFGIAKYSTLVSEKLCRLRLFNNLISTISEVYHSLESQKKIVNLTDLLEQLNETAENITKLNHKEIMKDEYISPALKYLYEPIGTSITVEERDAIQRETRDQSSSTIWKGLRKGRITASIAGKLYKSKSSVVLDNWHRDIKPNEAMQFGIDLEKMAIKAVESSLNLTVKDSGLWLDVNRPFLAASPDGLIYEEDKLSAVIEVKCPYSQRFKRFSNITNSAFLKNTQEGHCLDRNHDYYYQVQMQMGITNVRKCLFAAYTGLDIYTEWIEFDPLLWESMLVKFDKIWNENKIR